MNQNGIILWRRVHGTSYRGKNADCIARFKNAVCILFALIHKTLLFGGGVPAVGTFSVWDTNLVCNWTAMRFLSDKNWMIKYYLDSLQLQTADYSIKLSKYETFQVKYITSNNMHSNIYDVFYSQYSHQHVSVGIPAIFRVIFLLQQHN